MSVMNIAALLFFSILLVGIVLVAHGTIVKNRWGINLEHPPCPQCKSANPIVRAPQTTEETLWGGWTCPACGCKVSKWGQKM